MDQNVDFSGSDQIQTPQYPEIHPPSQEISEEVFHAKGDLMKSIQTFLEEFNYIPFKEKPQILLQAWFKFFAIKQAQPEDSNELLQKLLEDLKELTKYVNSPSRDRPNFLDNNEDHYNMEHTILELVEICRQKELLCMHDNVDDHIESALNSKLLSINSQRLEKEKQEVKNVVEQPIEHNDDFTSSDDESLSEEDIPIEESNVFSNPLFDNDEINSDELESHLEEFSGELAHINLEITKSDFDFEKEIRLIENLLYDNSSPRPSKEVNAEIANTTVESIPSSLIPVQDNDSPREEIDIVTNTDELLPPSVENDDDSEREIDAVDDVRVDNSIFNSENELSDNEESDLDNPSFPRPPPEPPDAKFDFEPDFGEEISVVMNTIRDEFDVSNNENDDYFSFMFVIRIFLPDLIYSKAFSFLSAESEDTIYDPGIPI
nr:hypothetical protein [Tanacetum cinerariifolium]